MDKQPNDASADETIDTDRDGEATKSPIQPKLSFDSGLGSFGDYELVEQIAEGGMGVVYQARQRGLNRTVAIKMIRAGQFAGEAEVKRFTAEAEAAANLQHPNIVPIHEIGEHEGRHFYSMDFIRGRTLAEIAEGSPMSASEAARHLKTIAEAIDYAHQQGILHRDLKPQNVIVEDDGTAHVTDFGLAKRVDSEMSLTITGAVMGSPQFMAPEQAIGDKNRLSPATDVYGLGGILYFLLVGRSAFDGDHIAEILQKVISANPEVPSTVNAKIPGDLETICLKCLEKDPKLRYQSAAEVARELERFLNYEPIEAKPAGKVRKTVNWTQKNPWAVTATFAGISLLLSGAVYALWQRLLFQEIQSRSAWSADAEIPRSPAIAFFRVFVAVCVLIVLDRRSFGRMNLSGDTDPQREFGRIRFHALMGMGMVLFGLMFTFSQIHHWAWFGFSVRLIAMEVLQCACCLWLIVQGTICVWESVGAYENTSFSALVDSRLEREMAAERRSWPLWKQVFATASLGLALVLFMVLQIAGVGEPVFYQVRHLTMALIVAGTFAPLLLFLLRRQLAHPFMIGLMTLILAVVALCSFVGFSFGPNAFRVSIGMGLTLAVGIAILRDGNARRSRS